MSTELERHTGTSPVATTAWVELLPAAADLARQLAPTSFVPDAYRGKPAEIAACVLYGHELGIGPMVALSKIDIVKGRPAPRAELARALVLAAGHELWLEEATLTRVTMCGRRRNSDHVHRVTWTMDDAKRAGLSGSQTWRQYPRQMLTARATTELVRTMAPDVLGGIALFAEEITDGVDEPIIADDVPAIEAAATEPAKQTRKRAAKTPAKATPKPSPKVAKAAPAPPPLDDLDLDAPLSEPAAIAPAPPADLDDTEPAAKPDGPSTSQMRAMHASLNDQGISGRDDRLAFVSACIGRPVDSSKDITRSEANAVLNVLDQLGYGLVAITVHESGEWEITVTGDDLEVPT